MANNWAFIIWIGITGLLCNAFGGKRQELVNGKSEVRTTWFWAIVIFIPIVLGAALRTTAEGDSPLSSKIQKNNCRQRHPGFGRRFFNCIQGFRLLATA